MGSNVPKVKVGGKLYERPDLTADMIESLKNNDEKKPHLCRTCGVKDCTAYLDISDDAVVDGLYAPGSLYITKCRNYVKANVSSKPLSGREAIGKNFDSLQGHIVDPTVSHNMRKFK